MLSRIYLDHNAGAPLRSAARSRLDELLRTPLGNPSSLHAEGRRARDVLEEAREDLARLLRCERDEFVFTSGGTEANALAVNQAPAGEGLAVGAAEHPSLLAAAEERPDGRLLPVDADGRLKLDEPLPRVALVSAARAQHETGALQDIVALRRAAHAAGARVHTDLCQAFGRIPVDLGELDVDLASVSAHKLGGLPGIGALVARRDLQLAPLWLGGAQEDRQRPGTEAVLLAAAFAAAAGEAEAQMADEAARTRQLTTHLRRRISDLAPDARVLTPERETLPNTLNVALPGRLGAHLVLRLDLEGVAVSHGSACASGSVEPSRALLAMGYDEPLVRASLRLSVGPTTTLSEVDEFLSRLAQLLATLDHTASEKNARTSRRT